MVFQEGANEGENRLVRWEDLRDAANALRDRSGLSTLRNDPRTQGPQPRANEHPLEQYFRLDSLAPSANADRPQNAPPLLERPELIKFRKQAAEAARAPNATWDQQMTATILEYYPFRESLPPGTPNINEIRAGANMQITRMLTNLYGVTEFLSTLDLYWRFLERNPSARTQPPRNAAIENRLLEDARTLTALMPYWGRVLQIHFIATRVPPVAGALEAARKQLIDARNTIPANMAGGLPTAAELANMDVSGLRRLTETITPIEGRMREIMFTRTEAITMPRHNPTTVENLARRMGGEGGEKRAREILSGVGLSEAPMKAIQARQVHAAYINLLTQHRSAQSEQFIGKVAAGDIAPEQVANMFRDHQQIGQLIMQEHLFGLQTTAAHMYAGTLGVSTTLQQNPERRLADFTPQERDKIFKQYFEMLAAIPQGQQQDAMREQREKSAKALQNYIRCMREEALQLRTQLRVVDVIYIHPAVQTATDGLNVLNAFMESIAANALNWVIWGPILSYYYPSLHDLVGVNADLPTIRNRLETIRKNAQEERNQLQSLSKTITEAREALEKAEEDLAGPLAIITGMQAGDVLDPARIKAAQDALKQITQIQETVGKTMTQTWNRIEINQKHHAETAAALADAQGAYRRMGIYAYTAAGIVVGGYVYSYAMVRLTDASRLRYVGNAAFPLFSPLAQMGWDTYRGVRAAVNWARGGEAAAPAAEAVTQTARPAAEILGAAEKLRGGLAAELQAARNAAARGRTGRMQGRAQTIFSQLADLEREMQAAGGNMNTLRNMRMEMMRTYMTEIRAVLADGRSTTNAIDAFMAALEGANSQQLLNAIWAAHLEENTITKSRMLIRALQNAGLDQNAARGVAGFLLDSGVAGIEIRTTISPAMLERLIATTTEAGQIAFYRRLITLSSDAERATAMRMFGTSEPLMTAFMALEDAQLQRAVRILRSPAMAEFTLAGLEAAESARLVQILGRGTSAELRGFLSLTQEARVLVLGLQEAELLRILALCGETVEARAAIVLIAREANGAARLALLSERLALPGVAALLHTEHAGAAAAINILSDASKATEAAEIITAAGRAATAAERVGILVSIWRGTLATIRFLEGPLAILAVGVEAYNVVNTMMTIEEQNKSLKNLYEQMCKLLPENKFSRTTETVDGRECQMFVHTETNVKINFTQLMSQASQFLSVDYVRQCTNVVSLISAVAMLTPAAPVALAAFIVMLPAGSIIDHWESNKWRDLLRDLPPELLAFLPTEIFRGREHTNRAVYCRLRTARGRSAFWNTVLFNASQGPGPYGSVPNAHQIRAQEAAKVQFGAEQGQRALEYNDAMHRALFFSVMQEIPRHTSLDLLRNQEGGREPTQSVWNDIGFIHQCFDRYFTEETDEKYNEAITRAVRTYVDFRHARFYSQNAPTMERHNAARERLSKGITNIIGLAPLPEPTGAETTTQELVAAITAGSPAERGYRTLSGITTGPLTGSARNAELVFALENFSQAQAITILTELGNLSDADRSAVILSLSTLSPRQRHWMLELFLPQVYVPENREQMLKACREAAANGLIEGRRAASLNALVNAVGNTMLNGGAFSIRDYTIRSAAGLDTPGLPRMTNGTLNFNADAALANAGEELGRADPGVQGIEQIVASVLMQPREGVTIRRARTTLADGGARRTEVGPNEPGVDCYVAEYIVWDRPEQNGVVRNGQTYKVFFQFNTELQRWFWASDASVAFTPVTLWASGGPRLRNGYAETQVKQNQAFRMFNELGDIVSRQEANLRLPPHPRAQQVWEASQKVLLSWGARPAEFPNGLRGLTYSRGGDSVSFVSVGGRMRWRANTETTWRLLSENRWTNPAQPSRQEMNRLVTQLQLIEDNLAAEHDMAGARRRQGETYFTEVVGHANVTEVNVDGYRGYRVSDNGATIECAFFGGAWLVREPVRGVNWWWSPANFYPGGNNSHTLRTIVDALNGINNQNPSGVTGGAIDARTEGRELLRGLTDPAGAAKTMKANFEDSLRRGNPRTHGTDGGTAAYDQRPTINANNRSSGHLSEFAELARVMHATFDQETGITTVSRLPMVLMSDSSTDAMQIRNSAGQWQFRYRRAAPAGEAGNKARADSRWGEWTPLRTDQPVFAESIAFEEKYNQSTLRSAAVPFHDEYDLRNVDNTSIYRPQRTAQEEADRAAARAARAKEAAAELKASQERVQFFRRCQTIANRMAEINTRTGLWH